MDEKAVHGYKHYYSSCSSVKSERWAIRWQLWDKLYLIHFNWLKNDIAIASIAKNLPQPQEKCCWIENSEPFTRE